MVLMTVLSACTSCTEPTPPSHACSVTSVSNSYTRDELLKAWDERILAQLAAAEAPDNEGAMGRNKDGYFHVRFQMGIGSQADDAVARQDAASLQRAVLAMEYSFRHQLPDGNFSLDIPEQLEGDMPTEGDLASGVAFFMSSLGTGLVTLDGSAWYQQPSNAAYRQRVEALREPVQRAAYWLASKRSVLEAADAYAPNRLFFDAVAFYSAGQWLKDDALTSIGLSFAKLALAQKHPDGYFIEGGGWDTSYQGVAIQVGLTLYSLLPEAETFKRNLWDQLSCAAEWQKQRVLPSGEISSEGNTRVYPGGELFLGEEKEMAWKSSVIAFHLSAYYTGKTAYADTAERIIAYYR